MKDDLLLLSVILLLLGPYSLLFYKKIGVRVRLLFISMIEIFVLCTMITIVYFANGFLTDTTYSYNLFVWLSVLLNLILILFSWLFERIKRVTNKPKI
jgi:hypothetical protein